MITWPLRRWLVAAVVTALVLAGVGVPTAMIPTPVFGREVPTPLWAWPALALTAVLAGLVTATYVAPPGVTTSAAGPSRGGVLGGFLTYLAVGCPTCNKIALLALGSTGAVTWFAPLQPWLAVAGIGSLVYALRRRLAADRACPLPTLPRRALDE